MYHEERKIKEILIKVVMKTGCRQFDVTYSLYLDFLLQRKWSCAGPESPILITFFFE